MNHCMGAREGNREEHPGRVEGSSILIVIQAGGDQAVDPPVSGWLLLLNRCGGGCQCLRGFIIALSRSFT